MGVKDMLISDGNGRTSGKKVVFLLTWVVGSIIVGQMAYKGTLNWDIFTAYLVFGMGSDTFAKLIALRYGAKTDDAKQ